MKYVLINGSTSFKFNDTTTNFSVVCLNENGRVTFKSTDTVVLAINYLQSLAKKISPVIDSDMQTLNFNSLQFALLPPNLYDCEIQVTDVNGNVSIYPDNSFIEVQITSNSSQVSGSINSYITLEDLITETAENASSANQKINEVIQNANNTVATINNDLESGAFKGATGNGISSIVTQYGVSSDVNTQPTSWSTAVPPYSADTPFYFVQTTFNMTDGTSYVSVQNSNFEDLIAKTTNIQGDIDTVSANLAELIQLQNQNAIGKKIYTAYADDEVGTNFTNALNPNLLTGTSSSLISYNASGYNTGIASKYYSIPSNSFPYTSNQSNTYTGSVYISPVSHDALIIMQTKNASGTISGHTGNQIQGGTSGISAVSYTLQPGEYIYALYVAFSSKQTDTTTILIGSLKLEKGSVATPYIPNIADSNYLSSYPKYRGIAMLNSSIYTDYTWSQSDEYRDYKEQQLQNSIVALGGTV